MGRRGHRISHKRRKYKFIQRIMILILLVLIGVLAFVIVNQKREEAEVNKPQEEQAVREAEEQKQKENQATKEAEEEAEAQKRKEEQAAKEAAEAEAQKQAEEEALAATQSRINKDVQTAENTATEEHHKTNGLAICMYHYVYDKNNPPKDKINSNFIEVHALEEELKYLKENNYYYPTWEEVEQYVKGELLLPEKSVVLTFDDGAYSFLNLGVPLFEKYEIPVTSFLIGNIEGEEKVKKYSNEYLTFQSHSYNMHRAGGNIGHGGIFPVMDHDEAVADLKQSIELGGNGDAFAYPYGDYNDSCVQAVKDAGFKCAVTTEYGRAEPGDDPLLLPRVRMSEGQSLQSFISLVE